MSEQQKVFASLSGAFVAHLVLLIMVFVLLSTRSIGSSLREPPEPPVSQPQEVVILMSDLMEQIELEEPEPIAQSRPFMDTDLNAPEAVAPENAKFESDRNTSAASEIAPDPNLAQVDLPTTRGESPLPFFDLQNREYTDGEFDLPPASNGAANESATPAGVLLPPKPESAVTDAAPGEDTGQGESEEFVDGVDAPPANDTGETLTRPEESVTDGEAEKSTMVSSFNDPNSSALTPAFGEAGEKDQFAASIPEPEPEAEVGDMLDPVQEQEMRVGGTGVDFENSNPEEMTEAVGEEAVNPADEGLFAEGYSPNQLQNQTNGTQSKLGQNAVDAEGTAAGAYKKKVKQLIGRLWHRSVEENGDFVYESHLRVNFRVSHSGKISDAKVTLDEANSIVVDFTLRAIMDAEIPPMPEEVINEVGPLGMTMDYDFILY
ncbi:MAG: hypothetical protein P1U58_13375 [Verrucomicrobiales bacterium]|nr:hypothetical protein [Verrucomicrobiales bacterium]